MDLPHQDYELIRHLVPPAVLGDTLDIALLGALHALDGQKAKLEAALKKLEASQRGDTIRALLVVNRARADLMEVLQLAHPESVQN
jgi:hypothetical protein